LSIEPKILPDDLWGHQKETVELAYAALQRKPDPMPYWGLLHDAGVGKTYEIITLLRNIFYYHKRHLKTLIICPSIVVENWSLEIDKFSKMGKEVEPLVGTGKQRIETLKKSKKHIFITNIEALDMAGLFYSYAGTKKKIKKVIPHGFECLVVDELHKFKGYRSLRTKLLIRMADKIYYRYGLTGTMILNTEEDVWSQARILDGGKAFGTNFISFRNEYFVNKNSGWTSQKAFPKWEIRDGAAEEIRQKLLTFCNIIKKEECLDLPPFVMTEIQVGMSPKQTKAYLEMKRDFITYLKDEACVATMALTKATRLMQIVSGFAKLDSGDEIRFKGNPRVKAFEELLQNISSKIIVWASFKSNYKDIVDVCEKLGLEYGLITGDQTKEEKDEVVKQFRFGSLRVVCANPQAGGTGINLTESDTAIWYSRSFRLEARLQGIARNFRGGSEMHDKITCIDLVTPGTIDTAVIEALNNKENLAANILDVKYV